jgi:hypothetical protein
MIYALGWAWRRWGWRRSELEFDLGSGVSGGAVEVSGACRALVGSGRVLEELCRFRRGRVWFRRRGPAQGGPRGGGDNVSRIQVESESGSSRTPNLGFE